LQNKRLASIVNGIDALSNWSGKIISYFIVVIVVVLLYEVVARYWFNSPTIWAHESSLLLFGIYAVMLGAYAHFYGAHVNMDLFYTRWSLRTRAIVDVCTFFIFLFWCGALIWFGTAFAIRSVQFLEHSTTAWGPPIWEIKLMIPLGTFLLVLQGVAKFIRDLNIAITGRALA